MSLCAEITVPRPDVGLGRVLADLDVRAEFDPLVPTDDRYLPYLRVDGERDAVDRFDDRVTGVDAVATSSVENPVPLLGVLELVGAVGVERVETLFRGS